MIAAIRGRVVRVEESGAVVELNGLHLQLMVPVSSLAALQHSLDATITLHTYFYLEGNPAGSHFLPRLVAFLSEAEREFFHELTRVKGFSTRRALRAMCLPTPELAAAIERGDERLLTTLPEVGKKTAAQMVAELRGKLQRFMSPGAETSPIPELSEPQRIAVEILVQWGDRRADAARLVAAAVESDPALTVPEEIVRAAYRMRQGARGG